MTGRARRLIRARDLALTGGAMAFVAALLVAAFWSFDAQVASMLARRQAAIVDTELQLLRLIDAEDGRPALIRAISRRTPLAYGDYAIQALIGPDGRYLAGDVDWPDGMLADGQWRRIATFTRAGGAVDGYGRAIILSDGAAVLIGRDHGAQRDFERSIVLSLVGLVFVFLTGTVALGLYLHESILNQLGRMAAAARRQVSGDAQERFPDAGDTEFARAGAVLNQLLDLNAQRLSQMRMVTDAIAHDMRQPFQRLRTHLDQAQSGDAEARQAALAAADAEMEDAITTLNNLLEVARAESGIGRDGFETVDLAKIASDLGEFFSPLAEEKNIALEVKADPAVTLGQPALIRHAVANLIQNAIKYTPHNGRVFIGTGTAGGEGFVAIQDNGPGIPATHIATALRPFGRLARDSATEGKGLGLALVAACAKLHGGRLSLDDAQPGLKAKLFFPVRD